MKINKESAASGVKNTATEEELKLINTYTRRTLKEDEVYVFSLTLCDNEVDRDHEVFSLNALNTLKELFVGKTGITDHDAKSKNQTARIFSTELQMLDGVNIIGERKARLNCKAYIPVTEFTKDVISRIESGILKEVSVGCSVKTSRCSICGKENCSHIKGRSYGGETCVRILDNADDAYEFSFVAVPAQRNAGVHKNFLNKEERNLTEIFKNLKEGESITLTYNEAMNLKKAAKWGESYRNSLVTSVKKACMMLQPEMDGEIMEEMALSLDIEKLVSLNKYYENELERKLPVKTQLAENLFKSAGEANADDGEFRI
ncbi:MAG: hypothetical protein E7564_03825 [Ruminococcaceae bacterium]|nr:hypothetical protein [Oscillospiraceae bacterium]